MKRSIDRSVLGYWSEKEVRLEAAHLLDQIDLVRRENSKLVTSFLSFALRDWAEVILRREQLAFLAEGGFPDAERVRIVMGPKGADLSFQDVNLAILKVRPLDPRAQLEHRQILGSLIGLGCKRDVLGDIRAGQNGQQYLAASSEIASFLINQWKMVGREKIEVLFCQETPDIQPDLGVEKRVTVSSSRLDALLAHAFGVSRTLAQEWIVQGKVRREGLAVNKADIKPQPGETISCRGYGRIKLLECISTRKERIAWQLVLYKSQRR
ncbi:YlmH/Sll1252 family protein [Desulfosporosinus sp. PR]|uniref:YlmH/Sll1252 family protein n=1 Tax=Candidatus Desulfosporosinus nitrosoreducens TaxID=3401928 RepID=UPI0027FD29CA|nr:YlmH/Sll1252 family protein [Desulfosporosinus sp. PR]MDQ7096143.1 YlmH/Sll1252 family protein [Desulfosporosinus sp. PR]